ncbi:MAG: hypothetical protein PHE32_00520 [Candidatus Shapirobacteria bacterium]|nr:hypothetical protein [Candidatus Shapirobacteria bacterium]MDD4410180.1 hypothetical protein [Candidatus Shapirobacteria bacterium]
MNIKEFIKKYSIIIFLSLLVIVFIFVKIYFGEKNSIPIDNSLVPTPTVIESKGLSKEILTEYGNVQTKEDLNVLLSKLSEDQINQLPEIDPHYSLKLILPYESETFIVKSYLKANVLLVKAVGNDFEKSKNDLMLWLNKKKEGQGEEAFDEVVWEN